MKQLIDFCIECKKNTRHLVKRLVDKSGFEFGTETICRECKNHSSSTKLMESYE